jgi:hypothetical protein
MMKQERLNDEVGMMNENRGNDLKVRTKKFALRIIRLLRN